MDIKGPNLIKGVRFEGLRVIGDPEKFVKYYDQGIDELIYIDTVAVYMEETIFWNSLKK